MQDKAFLDTNVLLYLYDKDISKKSIAKKLLQSQHTISTQVLNEFSNISLKKIKLSTNELKEILSVLINHATLVFFSDVTIFKAIEIKEKYGFGYYDSLILSTALENNCTILYSEDMQHNQVIEDNLTIINPFIGLN